MVRIILVKVSLFRGGLTSKGNVAMKEASLEDEAQYAGTAHPLLLPSYHRAQKQVKVTHCIPALTGFLRTILILINASLDNDNSVSAESNFFT